MRKVLATSICVALMYIFASNALADDFFNSQKESFSIINETLDIFSRKGIDGLYKYCDDQFKLFDSARSDSARYLSHKKIWYAMSLVYHMKSLAAQRVQNSSSAAYTEEKKELENVWRQLTGVGPTWFHWDSDQTKKNYYTIESLYKARMSDMMTRK